MDFVTDVLLWAMAIAIAELTVNGFKHIIGTKE